MSVETTYIKVLSYLKSVSTMQVLKLCVEMHVVGFLYNDPFHLSTSLLVQTKRCDRIVKLP